MEKNYDNLQPGENKVLAQFSRRDNEEGTAPDWNAPEEVILTVVVRTMDLKHGGKQYRKGDLLTVNVKGKSWAEYGPQDYDPTWGWECEGWRMRVLKVLG